MAKRGRKSAAKGQPQNIPARPTLAPYEVDMTASAEAVYTDLYTRAQTAEAGGDHTNAICTTFRMVDEALEKIIPRDPINKRYALRDELSNIYRLKKGRLRICWIANSKMRRALILFISETQRKEGDVNDPYQIFKKLLMSGELDRHFEQMGVKKSLPSRMIH